MAMLDRPTCEMDSARDFRSLTKKNIVPASDGVDLLREIADGTCWTVEVT